MAYQTGAASSVGNLLVAIDSFLTGVAAPWTQNEFSGTGDIRELYLNLAANHISIDSQADRFKIYANTGYSSGSVVNAQAGVPAKVGDSSWDDVIDTAATPSAYQSGMVYSMTGPYTAHHFFYDATSGNEQFFCVVETEPGLYRHFGWGLINKEGAGGGAAGYTSGQFLTTDGITTITGSESWTSRASTIFGDEDAGTNDPSWGIRVGLDAVAEAWYDGQDFPTTGQATVYAGGEPGTSAAGGIGSNLVPPADYLAQYSNIYPGLEILPIIGRPPGSATPSTYSILGSFPMLFKTWMQFKDPGSVEDIGGDDYMFFPVGRKSSSTTGPRPNSYFAGIAYNRDI